jgi:hypothetical protein
VSNIDALDNEDYILSYVRGVICDAFQIARDRHRR